MNNQKIIHLLNQRVRYIQKHLNECLKAYDLYNAQWTILFCLKKNGPMTQTAISQYLNVEAPTVTRTMKRMEDNGWVKRIRGNDKRERLIQLTEFAEKSYDEIEKAVESHDDLMLVNLTEEEKEIFAQLLLKLG